MKNSILFVDISEEFTSLALHTTLISHRVPGTKLKEQQKHDTVDSFGFLGERGRRGFLERGESQLDVDLRFTSFPFFMQTLPILLDLTCGIY